MNRFAQGSLTILTLTLALAACSSRSDELRAWRSSDHDDGTARSPAGAPTAPHAAAEPPSPGEPSPHAATSSVMETWANLCVRCHGRIGRGDGPEGIAIHARDLGDPAWQAGLSNEQLAASIVRGKGAMPPFSLEPAAVAELVSLIRQMARATAAQPDAQP